LTVLLLKIGRDCVIFAKITLFDGRLHRERMKIRGNDMNSSKNGVEKAVNVSLNPDEIEMEFVPIILTP